MSTLELNLDPSKPNPHLLDTPLEKRYTTISIPSTYGRLNSSPQAGTVVGIVLGSVAGFVLLMYVLFLAVNPGALKRGPAPTSSTVTMSMDDERSVRSRRRPRPHNEVEVIEERDTFRDSYRRRPTSRHDHIVVEESLATSATGDADGDLIEVYEESSSAASDVMSQLPRRRSRERRRPHDGVRHVDPLAYGGESDYDSRRG
jgi:hypothetical protein